MSSFIFSFSPLAAAAALIVLVEGVCALALKPGFVERANVGLLDRFHNFVIFGKLAAFEHASPDIIQVGDSSGFHGVRPETVMRYLGGLTYVNLSCCADSGYRGYYGIADFMLRRNPSIKAVVLYVSLNNLPREDLVRGGRQMGELIQNSLTTPFARLSPPTIALRDKIADAFETKRMTRTEAAFLADMQQSTRQHGGWWAEHDRRLAGAKRVDYWRRMCGETGVAFRDDEGRFYDEDFVRGRQSYMREELERFALLAADHGAKLVVMFHPFSCRGLEGTFLAARREDIRALLERHGNMVAFPGGMLELWSTGKFASVDHLHIGYDEENSRRVGRLLAQYLGIRRDATAPADPAMTTDADAAPATRVTGLQWRSDGAVLGPGDGRNEMAGSHVILESAAPGHHGVEATMTGITPGATTVVSFPAKAIGARGVLVELRANGRRGGGYCDLYGETAQRDGDMLDVGLDVQMDGWSRCWVAMAFDDPTVTLRLSVLNDHLDPSYIGDGRSGVAVGDMQLRTTGHFLQMEPPPW
jgi:hypothetical protein